MQRRWRRRCWPCSSSPPWRRGFRRVVLPALAGFATDWLWYDEIRFESVFLTSLVARALLFIVTGLVAFAFLYGNIRWSRQRAGRVPTLYVNRVGAAPVDLSRVVPGL